MDWSVIRFFLHFVLLSWLFTQSVVADHVDNHRSVAMASVSDDFDQLLAMNLDQLMNISIVSKREENIQEAPGIVTVVTAKDIRRYGYRNLRDILNRQTHIQVMGSNLFPHNKVVMRGVNSSHVDSNVLLQINGRPIRETNLSSINHDVYSLFPVEAIEKIEIIRGPGSVLYGTNAFSGVINIVTARADSANKVVATGGSFNTGQIQAVGGGVDSGVEMFGALNLADTQAGAFSDISDQEGTRSEYPQGYRGVQGVFTVKYNGFSMNGLVSNSETDNVRSVFVYPATEHEFDRYYIDGGYRHPINDNWDVTANLTYHETRSLLTTLPGQTNPNSTGNSKTYLAEVVSQAAVSTELNLLAGANVEKSTGEGDTNFETISESIYGQLDYQFNRWIKLIAGAQYNKPDEVGGDWSPRLGAIFNLNENWGVKMLYSSAFRDASPLERFIDVPTVRGDSALKPEMIDTLDLQLFYYRGQHAFAVTYFHSKQHDIITRQPGTPVQIINGGSITFDGIELEGRWQASDQLSFLGNASYQTNETDSGEKDVTYAPDVLVKGGMLYEHTRGLDMGLYGSYFAASTLQNDSALHDNPNPSSYVLLTLNVEANLGQLFNSAQLNPFSVALYGDNLLDEEIFVPSINRTQVNSLPHHGGRGWYLSLRGDF